MTISRQVSTGDESRRERGCVAALRRILGDLAASPGLARAADLATTAAISAPMEGRVMYACLRSLPLPDELAAPTYDGLEPRELDQLVTDLEPIAAALEAVGSR